MNSALPVTMLLDAGMPQLPLLPSDIYSPSSRSDAIMQRNTHHGSWQTRPRHYVPALRRHRAVRTARRRRTIPMIARKATQTSIAWVLLR